MTYLAILAGVAATLVATYVLAFLFLPWDALSTYAVVAVGSLFGIVIFNSIPRRSRSIG